MTFVDSLSVLFGDVLPAFIDGVLWGNHTFLVMLATGLLFSIWSKFIQFRALSHGVQVIRGVYDDARDPGAINHFQALSTALSATVGLGNIGGVALAIGIGGPGALFWMWIVGFLGMAIKSVEVTLAMMYRDTSEPENPHGGAMWVITRGLGEGRGPLLRGFAGVLAGLFCATLLVATMTGGNMFQVWNVAKITNDYFGVPQLFTGLVLAALTAMVIIGGIKRIGAVTGRLVPVMCGMYIVAGLAVLALNVEAIPSMLALVVRSAFSETEAGGAFLGATAWFALTIGLRRAIFSNEAGQGSSPIAHSAAKTKEPVREGVVAGLEPFIDTCVVCTITALVILLTGTWNRAPEGTFAAEVALVPYTVTVEQDGREVVEQRTRVESSAGIEALPALREPGRWLPGNTFFLLAEGPETRENTGHTLVKVHGDLVVAEADGAGHRKGDTIIRWRDLDGTGYTIVDRGVHQELVGASLTGYAFDIAIPGLGKWLVTLTCWLFAVSTMISWSYYGEQGALYLFGKRSVLPYKVVFCLAAVAAAMPAFIQTDTELALLADLGTGLMLFANVPIILIMAPRAMAAFRDYFGRLDRGEMRPHAAPPALDVIEGHDVEPRDGAPKG
jgi:AGCS family alanine or glycine:cation symporter